MNAAAATMKRHRCGLTDVTASITLSDMVSSPAPGPQPEDLCASPLLIIHGSGLASEEHARRIAEQCMRWRFKTRVRAVDDCAELELVRFPSLVVCLPTVSGSENVRKALEPFAALVSAYRARWQFDLCHIRDGAADPIDAGVVHLYGETALLHHPTMRTAYKRACYAQAVDADPDIDLLRPYRSMIDPAVRPRPWNAPTDVVEETVQQTWQYIQAWGATEIGATPALLACIERCRKYYEDPKKPALRRPFSEYRLNRLDFILDGPDVVPKTAQARKAWNENGARVVRYVREQLQAVHVGIRRPGSPLAPNAQGDLRRLYESLKIVDNHLREHTANHLS